MTISLLIPFVIVAIIFFPVVKKTWVSLIERYGYRGEVAKALYIWFGPALIMAGLGTMWLFWGQWSALLSIWPMLLAIVTAFIVFPQIAQIGIRKQRAIYEPPRIVTHADGRQGEIIDGRYRVLSTPLAGSTPKRPSLLDRLNRLDQALGLED